jgi:hypothetical protein
MGSDIFWWLKLLLTTKYKILKIFVWDFSIGKRKPTIV